MDCTSEELDLRFVDFNQDSSRLSVGLQDGFQM